MHTQKKPIWGQSNKVAMCKPRREASGETKPANTLIFNFQLPELWEIPVVQAP